MRTLLYILVSFAIVGLAFWAYRENYATQQALAETDELHAEIRAAHMRLQVLRAEWAYLNRPDRLRELAELNFDKLGLLPLRPDQFGVIDQVAFRPEQELVPSPRFDLSNSVEVSTQNAREN